MAGCGLCELTFFLLLSGFMEQWYWLGRRIWGGGSGNESKQREEILGLTWKHTLEVTKQIQKSVFVGYFGLLKGEAPKVLGGYCTGRFAPLGRQTLVKPHTFASPWLERPPRRG